MIPSEADAGPAEPTVAVCPHISVRVEQTDPTWGRPDLNGRDMEGRARDAESQGVDVLVFPELSLTGYDLGRRAPELAVDLTLPVDLDLLRKGATLLGLPERGRDHLVYNSGLAVRDGKTLHVHRKLYLPTYGSFDEGRIFAPGRRGVRCFTVAPGWTGAILVCEDLWHPSLAYLAALRGADILFVLAAGAGRGAPDPGDRSRPLFASTEMWELLSRTVAVTHGMWVILANRVGVEGGLTFAGESLVVDPFGKVVARAPQGVEARLDMDLDWGAVTRARDGFSHLRDEDPGLVVRELEGVLAEREGRGVEGPG